VTPITPRHVGGAFSKHKILASPEPSRQETPVNVVLVLLVLMLVGSVIATIVIPPFLHKIDRTGRVDFYGIKFL